MSNSIESIQKFDVPMAASMIDHTLLKPEATREAIRTLCEEAVQHSFYSVCVNPSHVLWAMKNLDSSKVKVGTVVGFPLGANTRAIKIAEAEEAAINGVYEIDMVASLGAIKEKDWDRVQEEVSRVRERIGHKIVLKVILETALLTKEEIEKSSQAAEKAGADYVKTSTGFASGGATVEAVTIMRNAVRKDIGIKASGGIRTLAQMMEMVNAGATRIGTSAGVQILAELGNINLSE